MHAVAVGFGLGFFVAAQVGPMSLFLIRSTLRRGWTTGLAIGAGIAAIDTAYGILGIAGAGITIGGVVMGISSMNSGVDQRADVARLSDSLRQELTAKGLQFIDVDREPFRQALAKTTFYKEWKGKFGDEAWSHLEKTAGKLV
jgi:hypothetical protein